MIINWFTVHNTNAHTNTGPYNLPCCYSNNKWAGELCYNAIGTGASAGSQAAVNYKTNSSFYIGTGGGEYSLIAIGF